MRYSKYPPPTFRDLAEVLFCVLTAADLTVDPISLGYGLLGGDSRLGPLRAYLEAREAGALYVDDQFQIRLTDSPLASLLVWLCVFNYQAFLESPESI